MVLAIFRSAPVMLWYFSYVFASTFKLLSRRSVIILPEIHKINIFSGKFPKDFSLLSSITMPGRLKDKLFSQKISIFNWDIFKIFLQYLTKQTSALREVNDSRLKIYEQLEISISELEITNQKLVEENLADKVKIKRYEQLSKTTRNYCDIE